jgi:heptose I phosphotransferase
VRYGSLWERLVRGVRWSWVDPRYQRALPPNLDATVMAIDSRDRLHAKQGRSTARVVFHPVGEPARSPAIAHADSPVSGQLAVYLKRHYRLPWLSGLAALFDPAGRHSPGAAEWTHLERARALGVPVPEVVATGERIGPWASLQSYLMVAELTECQEVNLALPELASALDPESFAALKRRLVDEMARITATMHGARIFHKDLYLCHFYLDRGRLRKDLRDVRLALIDLHRLGEHRLWPGWWRWKDLGQLLYSTAGVAGIDHSDIERFWSEYQRRLALGWPGLQARIIRLKARRYLKHNRANRTSTADRKGLFEESGHRATV